MGMKKIFYLFKHTFKFAVFHIVIYPGLMV
jgi:hypothetical protein